MTASSRNFGLDILRTCAILPVLAVHFSSLAIKNAPNALWPAGGFGVCIFFVLSGFLIGGIMLRDFSSRMTHHEVRTFYIRRWMRTLPLYWVFFVATMFFTVGGFKIDPAFSWKCLAYLAFMQNFAWPLMAQWYHESWSLAIEEWFYLLFPLGFLVVRGSSVRSRILVVAIMMTVIPLIARTYVYLKTGNVGIATQNIVLLRLDSIAVGIFAVVVQKRSQQFIARLRLPLICIGLIAAFLCYGLQLGFMNNYPAFQAIFGPLITPASIALVLLGIHAVDFSNVSSSIFGFAIRWISTRSYSIYLCHGSILKTLLAKGYLWRPVDVSLPLFLVLVIVVAEMAHRLIEQPFMKMRPPERHPEQARSAAA